LDFLQATDFLMNCRNLKDVARETGVSYQTVRQARLAAGHPNRRPAPNGWMTAVSRLARERAAELERLADEIERVAGGLDAK
jgi:transposase